MNKIKIVTGSAMLLAIVGLNATNAFAATDSVPVTEKAITSPLEFSKVPQEKFAIQGTKAGSSSSASIGIKSLEVQNSEMNNLTGVKNKVIATLEPGFNMEKYDAGDTSKITLPLASINMQVSNAESNYSGWTITYAGTAKSIGADGKVTELKGTEDILKGNLPTSINNINGGSFVSYHDGKTPTEINVEAGKTTMNVPTQQGGAGTSNYNWRLNLDGTTQNIFGALASDNEKSVNKETNGGGVTSIANSSGPGFAGGSVTLTNEDGFKSGDTIQLDTTWTLNAQPPM